MVFSLSPAISVAEQDLSTIVPAVSSTPGAFAGAFAWGPVLERVLIDSENSLVRTFGRPDDNNYEYFFTASNFLQYTNALQVVRVVGDDATNSSSRADVSLTGVTDQDEFTLPYTPITVNSMTITIDGTEQTPTTDFTVSGTTLTFTTAPANGAAIVVKEKQLITNRDNFDTITGLISSVYAKYPGTLGNTLKVVLADTTSYASLSTATQSIFSGAPGTNEVHFAVIDEDGVLTGTAGSVLQRREALSTVAGTQESDGTLIYYKDWINRNSEYVWSTGTLTDLTAGEISLINGASDDAPNAAAVQAGFALFVNSDEVDVSFLIGGPIDSATAIYLLDSIAGIRKDCIAVISPEKDDVVNNVGSELTSVNAFRDTLPSTSYGVMDTGWKYQYDRYNDTERWVPLCGDTAGTMARTDYVADPWYSPGGYDRGRIKNVIKLAWNPTKAQRDELYKNGVNPIITEDGQGTILFGDKTLLAKPSAFNRINVRRLFIVLEKSIATAAKYTLFEFNDEFTRAQFVNLVEPFLRDVLGRRGITDYRVVCDETNNTSQVIDSNEFVADIQVKPARSINNITLNFVAVRTGVTFEELGA